MHRVPIAVPTIFDVRNRSMEGSFNRERFPDGLRCLSLRWDVSLRGSVLSLGDYVEGRSYAERIENAGRYVLEFNRRGAIGVSLNGIYCIRWWIL